MLQRTLQNRISCTGIGLHTGASVSLTLHPAPADTGIVFLRSDVAPGIARVHARWDRVRASALCTTIGNEFGTSVMTIEHLMAAFVGCGIDNVIVEVNGPEVPAMDGSAHPFVLLMECAGTVAQESPRRVLRVLHPVEIVDGDRRAALRPAHESRVDFEIDFDGGPQGADNKGTSKESRGVHQRRAFRGGERAFKEEIGRARTFGFAHEVDAMRARGFARGGSLDNAVVVDGNKVLNADGLRYEDEFVRHTILDCIGDLYLAGAPMIAHVAGLRSGHAVTHMLLRALFADKSAWRYEAVASEMIRETTPLAPAAMASA
jgi:UDP-3-O-[3-hydroxymyristoyl] N-acetylglucosamine deacetylase